MRAAERVRALLAVVALGCGGGADGSASADGGAPTGDAAVPGDGHAGGGSGDGGTGDGGAGDGTSVPVPLCADPVTTDGPLPTGVMFPQSTEPGPLMTRDARAFLFLEGSALWTTAQAGSASTAALPAPLAGGSSFGGFASLSGTSVVTFQRQGTARAVTFDGSNFGPERALPCTAVGPDCTVHAAGDGHLWVRTASNFHELVGAAFENRGGGPAAPITWDVDAAGTVIVMATGDSQLDEQLVVWKLSPGAGGWVKAGALHDSDVASVSSTIEGGFRLAAGAGAIAPDGSFHVFSDPRCIGTGERNKTQVYARSHDGVAWTVETLPDADVLFAGNVTWRHSAYWAASYDNARYVMTSSPKPTFDGYVWSYPDRRYDVVGRCLDATGTPVFERIASARLPGWTTRGYARFSETGAVALLTELGLTQAD